MVVCPPRLDSVSVTNTMTTPVTVLVAFDNHKEQIELVEEHRIEPGASYHFTEKVLDMGSWTVGAEQMGDRAPSGANAKWGQKGCARG